MEINTPTNYGYYTCTIVKPWLIFVRVKPQLSSFKPCQYECMRNTHFIVSFNVLPRPKDLKKTFHWKYMDIYRCTDLAGWLVQ